MAYPRYSVLLPSAFATYALSISVSPARLSRSVVTLRSAVSDYYDRVEYLNKQRGQMIGLPTGFARLDDVLGGMQRSDMLVLAARPSMGKTSLALEIAHTAAKKFGQRVLVYSLEMSSEQVVERLTLAEAGMDSQRLRQREIADDEWKRFIITTSILSELAFFIDDALAVSVLDLVFPDSEIEFHGRQALRAKVTP